MRRANVIGDEEPDTLEAMPAGQGLAIRDGRTGVVTRLPTVEYLTDFAVLGEAGSTQHLVVTLTYPNPKGTGTVTVFKLPAVGPKAKWEESPSPERLGGGTWKGEPALFRLQPDGIAAKAADGRLLATVPVPGAGRFSRLYPGALSGDRTVVLASGDGYTPYHMVAVFDAQGQLLFHEQANEHAWRLTVSSDGQAFDVDTRSTRWHYRTQ